MATVAQQLEQLNTIKNDIKTAITEKGQTVENDFSTYAAAISNITVGGDPLAGKINIETYNIVGDTGIGGFITVIEGDENMTYTREYLSGTITLEMIANILGLNYDSDTSISEQGIAYMGTKKTAGLVYNGSRLGLYMNGTESFSTTTAPYIYYYKNSEKETLCFGFSNGSEPTFTFAIAKVEDSLGNQGYVYKVSNEMVSDLDTSTTKPTFGPPITISTSEAAALVPVIYVNGDLILTSKNFYHIICGPQKNIEFIMNNKRYITIGTMVIEI